MENVNRFTYQINDKAHWYKLDGKQLTGVTTILVICIKVWYNGLQWHIITSVQSVQKSLKEGGGVRRFVALWSVGRNTFLRYKLARNRKGLVNTSSVKSAEKRSISTHVKQTQLVSVR